jgi:hypothetical protein
VGATYILYADYYAISCQWSSCKIAYFTNPIEIGAWAFKAGFYRRKNFTVFEGRNSERYIVAIARATPILVTMGHHVEQMVRAGGDDYAISMAYSCELDVKRWALRADRRGQAADRVSGDGAKRLGYPLRALAESAGLPTEGAGRWPD